MLSKFVSAVLAAAFMFNCSILTAGDKEDRSAGSGNARSSDQNWQRRDPLDIIKLIKGLNITAQQREKLAAEKKSHTAKMKSLQDSLRAKRAELSAELDKPVSDKTKLKDTTAEMKKIIAGMIDERISSALGIKEILTPEQYRQFVEKKNKLAAKHNK